MSDLKIYDEIFNAGIEELDLSVKAYNCIKRCGINTIGDLIDKIIMTDDKLLRVRNLGVYGKKEVIEKLKAKGLRLRREGESVQDILEEYMAIKQSKFSPQHAELLNTKIEDLDLSVRSFNCLKRCGINTIEDLIMKTEEELSRVKNLGKRGTKEVIDKLKTKGLRLIREGETIEDVLKEYESMQGYTDRAEKFADSVKGIDRTITNYLNALNSIINKLELPNEIWNRFYSSLKLPDTITIMGSEPEIESLNLAVLNHIDSCVNRLEIPDYIKLYWDEFYSELANILENTASSEIAKLQQGKGQGK